VQCVASPTASSPTTLALFSRVVFFYGTVFLVGQEPFNEQGHVRARLKRSPAAPSFSSHPLARVAAYIDHWLGCDGQLHELDCHQHCGVEDPFRDSVRAPKHMAAAAAKGKASTHSLARCGSSSWNVFTVLGAIFSISVYWLVLLVESFIPSTLPEQYNQFGTLSPSLPPSAHNSAAA